MGEVVKLYATETEADPRIADMAGVLQCALADARAGDVAGLALVQIRGDGAILTRWAIDNKAGHGAYIVAAATRLIHDLNACVSDEPLMDEEDDGA